MFNYIMSNVLGCVKKGGSKKKGGSNFFIFLMFCHSRGVRALARAQISYKTARVVRLTPLLKSQGTGKNGSLYVSEDSESI
jgi:hypothetical protein